MSLKLLKSGELNMSLLLNLLPPLKSTELKMFKQPMDKSSKNLRDLIIKRFTVIQGNKEEEMHLLLKKQLSQTSVVVLHAGHVLVFWDYLELFLVCFLVLELLED